MYILTSNIHTLKISLASVFIYTDSSDRETNRAAFGIIQQMSFKPPFPSMQVK